MAIILSALRKPLIGPTGGMIIGQTKIMRITGSPSIVTGAYFGLREDAIQLVQRNVEHVITDLRFIKFIYGEDSVLTEVTLPIITEIPYLVQPTYTVPLDPADSFYTRIF